MSSEVVIEPDSPTMTVFTPEWSLRSYINAPRILSFFSFDVGSFSLTLIEKSPTEVNTPGSRLSDGFWFTILRSMFSYLKLAYGITLLAKRNAPYDTNAISTISESIIRKRGIPAALNAESSLFSDRFPKVIIEDRSMATGKAMGTMAALMYIIISAMGRTPIPLPIISSA